MLVILPDTIINLHAMVALRERNGVLTASAPSGAAFHLNPPGRVDDAKRILFKGVKEGGVVDLTPLWEEEKKKAAEAEAEAAKTPAPPGEPAKPLKVFPPPVLKKGK